MCVMGVYCAIVLFMSVALDSLHYLTISFTILFFITQIFYPYYLVILFDDEFVQKFYSLSLSHSLFLFLHMSLRIMFFFLFTILHFYNLMLLDSVNLIHQANFTYLYLNFTFSVYLYIYICVCNCF